MQGLAIASIILAVASSEIPVPGTWHDTLAAEKFEKGSDSLVVSAVGDSITYGSCSSDPSSRAYPPQMADMVNNASRTIYNFGVSGATMMKTGDLPYWEQDAYAMALQSSPDIVVIMLGTNDAKTYQWDQDQFVTDYLAMIESFASLASSPKIYLNIPPPLYADGIYSMNQTIINEVFPLLVPAIAEESGVEGVIDVFSALGGADLTDYQFFCDGQNCDQCHPNDAGYVVLGATVYKTLFM